MLKILFLASDPSEQARLRLMEEHREIEQRIRLSKNRADIELATRLAVRPVDLTQALLDEQPSIVHFSGHGEAGAICLQDDAGHTKIVEPGAIASLLSLFAGQVRCVVLNACYSAAQAEAIAQHADYVVGMSTAISDSAAIAYSVGFYAALGAGRSVEDAHRFGVAQIALAGLDETEMPKLTARSSLGTPTFSEPPTAPPTRDYTNLVLLIMPVQNSFSEGEVKYRRVPVESGCRSSRHGGARRCRDFVAFSTKYSSLFLGRSSSRWWTGMGRTDDRRG